MQLFNKYDIEKRTLYYWSKRYSNQLQEGQSYKQLKKCITINILNLDREARRKYEERQKYLRDEASMIEWATDRGMSKGIAKGEQKKAIEIAKNMLDMGIEVSVIVKVSGLSEDEVNSLKSIQ